MLKLPVRIVLIILIIVLGRSFKSNESTQLQSQKQVNYYVQNSTSITNWSKEDGRVYLETFLKNIETGKLKDAYAMIGAGCKIDEFKTQSDFEKYIKRYVVDTKKWGKVITFKSDIERGDEEGNIIYNYQITVMPKDFKYAPVNPYEAASKAERKDYFTTKNFYLNVIQSGVYQYKIMLFSKSIK